MYLHGSMCICSKTYRGMVCLSKQPDRDVMLGLMRCPCIWRVSLYSGYLFVCLGLPQFMFYAHIRISFDTVYFLFSVCFSSHLSLIFPHPLSPYLCVQSCRHNHKAGIRTAKGDIKLLFVPLIFLLLRIWSSIISVAVHFSSDNVKYKFLCSPASDVFIVLAVSCIDILII